MSRGKDREFNVRGIANVMCLMAWVSVIPAAAPSTLVITSRGAYIPILGFIMGFLLLWGYHVERGKGFASLLLQRVFWALSTAFNGLPLLFLGGIYFATAPEPLRTLADLPFALIDAFQAGVFSALIAGSSLYALLWLPVATVLSAIALQKRLAQKRHEAAEEEVRG